MSEASGCAELPPPTNALMTDEILVAQNNMAGVNYFQEILAPCPDVCLLQDPSYRSKDGVFNIRSSYTNGYRKYYCASQVPRALILTSLHVSEILVLEGDCVCLKIGSHYFGSLYLDPRATSSDAQNKLESLLQKIPRLELATIGIDSNGHHPSWGSSTTCTRGRLLAESFSKFGLLIANRGAEPTFFSRTWKTGSAIDITVAGSSILPSNWTLVTSSFSDHEIIHFRILGSLSCPQTWKTITDFPRLREVIATAAKEAVLSPLANAEETAGLIQEILSRSQKKCSRIVKPFRRPSKDVQALISDAKRLKRRWRRNPSVENRLDLDRVLQSLHSKSKRPLSPGLVRRFTKEGSSGINQISGESPKIQDFFNSAGDPFNFQPHSLSPLTSEEFTRAEIMSMFSLKARKNSAPSPMDGCSYKILNEVALCSPEFLEICHSCFNLSWTEGHFPTIWKRGHVIFIPKRGKASWRPITLLTAVSKILESLIASRLDPILDSALPATFFGFIKNRSTESCLIHRLSTINSAPELFWAWCDLDLKNAFNNVRRNSVLEGLTILGVPAPLTNILISYLSDRFLESTTETATQIWKSVPQGGILAPKLFNVSVLPPFLQIKRKYPLVDISLYADDCCLLTSAPSVANLSALTSAVLTDAEKIFNDYGSTIADEKSQVLLIKRRSSSDSQTPILLPYMGSKLINVKASFKSLGVIVDNSLSFELHAYEVLTNSSQKIWRLARFARSNHIGMTNLVFNQVIKPGLLYCSCIWAHQAHLLKNLAPLGGRSILGAMRTSSSEVCVRASGLFPMVDIIRTESTLRLLHSPSLLRCPNLISSNLSGISVLRHFLLTKTRIPLFGSVPRNIPAPSFSRLPIGPIGPGIYCDGSLGKSVLNCGSACIFLDNQGNFTNLRMARIDPGSPYCDVLSSELLAIQLAIPVQRANPEFYIFSDNRQALAIAEFLNWSSRLCWLPSKLNPADPLAKRAGRSGLVPTLLNLPMARGTTKRTLMKLVDLDCRQRWRGSLSKLGRTINGLLSQYSTLLHLAPHLSHESFRMIQGHNCFPRANALRRHCISARCLYCFAPQANSLHMILECPRTRDLRVLYFGRTTLSSSSFQQLALLKPSDICGFLSSIAAFQRKASGNRKTPLRPLVQLS